jgi:tetratricopeptide (TPR) repeat protein
MTIDVCATLDGLPLALELAAASLQRMTLAEMDAALHHMDGGGWIKLLTTSARDLPARQRTLVNVVAWSYTLLTHPQQTLFAQLSLFSKWFDLDAVTAVCDLPSAPGHMPVRDLLEELSDHSLLVRGDIEGVPCWRMLEVIKEFAALQLLSQARPPLQARLLQFLQVNLNELEKDLDFHKHRRFYEIHTASLHTALSWLIARQEAELAFQLVSRLGDFWEQWGFHREGLEFSKQLLALPDPSQPLLRATCLQKASDLAWQVHDFKTSLDFSHQAAELGRLHQLISPQVWHLNRLGRIFIEQERYAEARHALVESITLSRANHSVLNVGIPLAQLGELALFENRIQESKTFLSEAQSHLSQAYPIFWAMITVDMAEIAIQEGDFGHACAWLKRAIPYASLHIRRTLIFLGTLAGYLVSSHPDSEAHLRAATRFYGALHSFTEQFAIRPGTFHRRLNDQCMQIIQERLSPGDFQAELRIGAEWSREKVFSEAILITQECA